MKLRNDKCSSEIWAVAIEGVQITRLRSGEVRAKGVGAVCGRRRKGGGKGRGGVEIEGSAAA